MKKNTKRLKILDLMRKNCSTYGNPAWELFLQDENGKTFTARTASNAACAYMLGYSSNGKTYNMTYHETRTGNIIIDYIIRII